jgi:predicted site-specific integrase-resolvase
MRLRTPEAAQFLGIATRTLEKWRLLGCGPVYRRLRGPRGPVVYDERDLEKFLDDSRRTSTSDAGSPRNAA